MTDIWTKAPEGATHYFAPFFYKVDGDRVWMLDESWEPSAYNISQIDSLGVKRPASAQPWPGDGLPPVGTECEVKHVGHHEWVRHKINYIGPDNGIVVFQGERASEFACPLNSCEFRPIKTPAQIAAEEREAAIEAIYELISSRMGSLNVRELATAIHDSVDAARAIADT